MYLIHHLAAHFGAKIFSIQEPGDLCMDSYQFFLVQEGTIILDFSDTNERIMLQKNDVILITPNRPFRCTPFSSNRLIGVRLERTLCAGMLKPHHFLICDSTKSARKEYQKLRELLTDLCVVYYQEDNHYLLISRLFELLDLLKKNFVERGIPKDQPSTIQQQERIIEIEQYLQTYYHRPVSLMMLADKFFLTPQYLSKFIKQHLGCNFSHYLTKIRLEHAVQELIHTNHSITVIALNNGFPNIEAFNKAFRDAFCCSPSTYRTQHQLSPENTIADAQLSQEAADGTLPNLSLKISTAFRAPRTYQKPWCDTINIGSLVDALKVSFHDSFLEYRSAIPVRYVRFYDLFSPEVIPCDPQTGEFDFTTLDEVLEFFYNADVIPFVELSSKPRITHTERFRRQDYWHSIFVPEQNDMYYYELLKAILVHCLRRFGILYMSQWRFELWLKHGDHLLYPSSFDAYFEKYKTYYHIIKEILPDCTMGGPGFNMCGNMTSFQKFLTQAAKEQITFDFITLYGFGYETLTFENPDIKDTFGMISGNPNHIRDTFFKYQDLIKRSWYQNLPVYITELTSSVSLENHIVDTVFQAAFLCHTMLQLLPCCSCVSYLSFWDRGQDISLPSSIYFPSSSLVSDTGIPKPALHAYSFLARLGKHLVSQGDQYILTCDSSNQFQLLFYHYTHFNQLFCLNPWETFPMEQTYDLFETDTPQQIRFRCSKFPPGRYKMIKYSLNRSYGSALDKHLRTLENNAISSAQLFSALGNLKEDERRYYKQTSIPRQDVYYIECTNALSLEVVLDPHEIIFYELSRIL